MTVGVILAPSFTVELLLLFGLAWLGEVTLIAGGSSVATKPRPLTALSRHFQIEPRLWSALDKFFMSSLPLSIDANICCGRKRIETPILPLNFAGS